MSSTVYDLVTRAVRRATSDDPPPPPPPPSSELSSPSDSLLCVSRSDFPLFPPPLPATPSFSLSFSVGIPSHVEVPGLRTTKVLVLKGNFARLPIGGTLKKVKRIAKKKGLNKNRVERKKKKKKFTKRLSSLF